MRNKAPCPRPILIPMAVHRCNTKHIAQCSMPRATLEATGCQHWATTGSALPQCPPGQQADKQQSNNTPTKLAVLMAIAMWRYNTARISQWRRSRASLEATGLGPIAINRTCQHRFFPKFFIVKLLKKAT